MTETTAIVVFLSSAVLAFATPFVIFYFQEIKGWLTRDPNRNLRW